MKRVTILGGAGLVGQNLTPLLASEFNVCVVDKNRRNLQILKELNPAVRVLFEDLNSTGEWQSEVANSDFVVSLNAQISSTNESDFRLNNILATEKVISELTTKNPQCHIVHVSSSVVNSLANDFYSDTKRSQEILVVESGLSNTILRPTLMFGPLDRKHLGWLSRFIQKTAIFPIPGSGDYQRQPLFVGDFCQVILSVLRHSGPTGTFDISGRQVVSYVNLIRKLKKATGSKAALVRIPFWLFDAILKTAAKVSKNPPFTSQQLHALVIPEVFPIIDWPSIFKVQETDLETAFERSFVMRHPLEGKLQF